MPLISIILTSYNHAKFIGEAIESVVNQTFSDWELFIFDDASSDDSLNIIQSYFDPRIKAFRNSVNQGPTYAFNKVIFELAQGEYIAIHHSDDVWELSKLQKQVDFLEANTDIGAVFSNAQAIDERGAPLTDSTHFYHNIFSQPNRSRHEWLRFFFLSGNALCHPSILIRKQCYEDCGPYLDVLAQLPDFDMWVRLCSKFDIHVMEDRLIKFRVLDNEMNTSGNRPTTRIRSRIEYYKVLQRYRLIIDKVNIFKIFPHIIGYDRGEDTDPEYILASVCLESTPSCARHFLALEIFFDILSDPSRRCTLEKLYEFSLNNFLVISGRFDPFAREEIFGLQTTLTEREKQLGILQVEIDRIKSTVSWQITKPLRFLANLPRFPRWPLTRSKDENAR